MTNILAPIGFLGEHGEMFEYASAPTDHSKCTEQKRERSDRQSRSQPQNIESQTAEGFKGTPMSTTRCGYSFVPLVFSFIPGPHQSIHGLPKFLYASRPREKGVFAGMRDRVIVDQGEGRCLPGV